MPPRCLRTQPRLFCDIAEWNGEPAGFSVWFLNFSTFRGRHGIYVEDLFVRPAFRGNGIGKALMQRLARRCVEEGWARFEWAVLDWNAPSNRVLSIDRRASDGRVENLPAYRQGLAGFRGRGSRAMKIVLVAAIGENNVIGRDGALPWRLKSDLKHFRQVTLNRPVIMGRKTYVSIGKPLKDRTNIVLTSDLGLVAPGAVLATSLDAALAFARQDAEKRGVDEIMVIGGSDVFAAAMPKADSAGNHPCACQPGRRLLIFRRSIPRSGAKPRARSMPPARTTMPASRSRPI